MTRKPKTGLVPKIDWRCGVCMWLCCVTVNAYANDDSLIVHAPTVRANPIQRAPLVAIVEFETSIATHAMLEISDGQRHWEQAPQQATAVTQHRIVVLGMRPGRQHEIRVRLVKPNGGPDDLISNLSFETPPLPANFPPLRVNVAQPDKMEPGITLFAANLWIDDQSMMDYGYIIMLDQQGEVVWYCHTQDRIADLRVLANGNLLYQHGSYRYAYEIDLLGRDLRSWYASNLTLPPNPRAIGVAVDTLHHEISELPNGNFLTLATELRQLAKFPTSLTDARAPWGPAEVVCDSIVEFRPNDGQIMQRLDLADVIDPNRAGYLSLGGFWKDKYDHNLSSPSRDWIHANGVVYLPEEQAVVVSLRHLDCLVKINWLSQQVRWILGTPDGWSDMWQPYLLKPIGDLQWSYHQHAPQVTSAGRIRLYDNGNYRARPYEPIIPAHENSSRIVEYEIDEVAMTVRQTYQSYGPPGDSFYCPFYGEADHLPVTGNLLVTNGGHIELADGTPSDDVPSQRQWARIFEMTRDHEPNEKVFEVICDSGLDSRYGWSIYRAERLPNDFSSFQLLPPDPHEQLQVHPRLPINKRDTKTSP